ncbi:hypothetical protein [Actinomadura gamaensis]|uniref:Uncharacterized protein n=1 Tax=Actinomadura gamaensis TaxID=1763541 RepID=A0ABV9TW15_9ACTN
MKPKVSIVVLVDAVGALSDGTLHNGNLSMVDDSPLQNPLGSRNRGTPDLVTVVRPGQVVQWTPIAVDVQTPVEIQNIEFLSTPAPAQQPTAAAPPGYAPQPGYSVQPVYAGQAASGGPSTPLAPSAQAALAGAPAYAAQGALPSGMAATSGTAAAPGTAVSGTAAENGTALGPVATASNGFENHDLLTWEGFVPFTMAFGVPYRYRLTLRIHDGVHSVMSIDSPALLRG